MTDANTMTKSRTGSRYKDRTRIFYDFITEQIRDSEDDHFASSREYIVKKTGINLTQVGIIETSLVENGCLNVKRSKRYGRTCREYRILGPLVNTDQADKESAEAIPNS